MTRQDRIKQLKRLYNKYPKELVSRYFSDPASLDLLVKALKYTGDK